jgi:predicted MFS family arabinose efflux permease
VSTSSPVRVVALSAFASTASMRLCDPMLGGLSQEFGVTTGEASAVIAAYAVSYGVLQIVYGPMGERLGKLRVIGASSLVCLLISLLTALAPSLNLLVLARAAMGAAAAGIIPLAIAWVGDQVAYEQRQEALARLMGASITGMMMGQWFGGFSTQHWGWRYAFVAVSAIFGVALWGMAMYLKNQPRFVPSAHPLPMLQYWQHMARLLTQARVRWVLGAALAEGALVMGTLAFMPSRLVAHFGLSVSQAGGAMVLYGASGLLYSQLARQSLALLGEKGLAWCGGALIVLGLSTLALAHAAPWGVAACGFSGLGFYMMHNTLQTQGTQMAPQARSMAVTLFACTLFFGQTLGVAAVARSLDAGWMAETFLVAAVGVAVLCHLIARGGRGRVKTV